MYGQKKTTLKVMDRKDENYIAHFVDCFCISIRSVFVTHMIRFRMQNIFRIFQTMKFMCPFVTTMMTSDVKLQNLTLTAAPGRIVCTAEVPNAGQIRNDNE